ncbi:DUF4331 domain-containing protein [Polycyclovorans algicola]|uniref:DUF4331 domain-containing protein n=1 Tax=Polycyclovorans algicola TaxID=616992 RepID=UPI0004A6B0B0|nr:DUF4331 domain-containing protein [Polycyclovorans algicola]
MSKKIMTQTALAVALATAFSAPALASSHREAPFITTSPKVDGTDFYMFRSYEEGREGFVTLIANYLPLQDAYGGPNYFALDPNALYEIHIDNDGDAVEDITFGFRFTNTLAGASLNIGPDGAPVAVPLRNIGGIGPGVADSGNSNLIETYEVSVTRGDRRSGDRSMATNADGGDFVKPTDNIGGKSIPDYPTYAGNHIFPISIPGCATDGKVFVGQRKEGFPINLGQVFDLVNLNPLGERQRNLNIVDDKNITSIALEVPISCLTEGEEPVIGGWTTASLRQARVLNPEPQRTDTSGGMAGNTGPEVVGGAWSQVSRLGSPLVNEVVIGLPDKDLFNTSEPSNDVDNFGAYVLYPTLPVLIDILFFGGEGNAVPATPRTTDLLPAFVTGVPGLNQPAGGGAGEMLRLNTAIDVTPAAMQSDLGFLGCDLAGFPNGRRPLEDVTDIALNVVMGAITAENQNELQTCDLSGDAPAVVNAGAVVNDGALFTIDDFLPGFPYLNHPTPGAPAVE